MHLFRKYKKIRDEKLKSENWPIALNSTQLYIQYTSWESFIFKILFKYTVIFCYRNSWENHRAYSHETFIQTLNWFHHILTAVTLNLTEFHYFSTSFCDFYIPLKQYFDLWRSFERTYTCTQYVLKPIFFCGYMLVIVRSQLYTNI
jgi:hypothetical protein